MDQGGELMGHLMHSTKGLQIFYGDLGDSLTVQNDWPWN
jgi:hypothetical protein